MGVCNTILITESENNNRITEVLVIRINCISCWGFYALDRDWNKPKINLERSFQILYHQWTSHGSQKYDNKSDQKSSHFTGWRLMPFNGLMFWVSQQAADHWFQGALLDSWRSLRFAEVARQSGGLGARGWRGKEEEKMRRWILVQGGDVVLWWGWRVGRGVDQSFSNFRQLLVPSWKLSLLRWRLFLRCCSVVRLRGNSLEREPLGVDLVIAHISDVGEGC